MWLEDLRQNADKDLSIILIGNKCDLTHKRVVSTHEGLQFAKNNGLLFMEVSAKTALNVDQVMIHKLINLSVFAESSS